MYWSFWNVNVSDDENIAWIVSLCIYGIYLVMFIFILILGECRAEIYYVDEYKLIRRYRIYCIVLLLMTLTFPLVFLLKDTNTWNFIGWAYVVCSSLFDCILPCILGSIMLDIIKKYYQTKYMNKKEPKYYIIVMIFWLMCSWFQVPLEVLNYIDKGNDFWKIMDSYYLLGFLMIQILYIIGILRIILKLLVMLNKSSNYQDMSVNDAFKGVHNKRARIKLIKNIIVLIGFIIYLILTVIIFILLVISRNDFEYKLSYIIIHSIVTKIVLFTTLFIYVFKSKSNNPTQIKGDISQRITSKSIQQNPTNNNDINENDDEFSVSYPESSIGVNTYKSQDYTDYNVNYVEYE